MKKSSLALVAALVVSVFTHAQTSPASSQKKSTPKQSAPKTEQPISNTTSNSNTDVVSVKRANSLNVPVAEETSYLDLLKKSKDATLDGERVQLPFSNYKAVLIVNTASKCGLVDQLKDLQELHEKYGSSVLVVGVPTGDFKSQEFATNEEIKAFCATNYQVDFTMLSKNSAKNPLEGTILDVLFNQINAPKPTWNYQKYLLSFVDNSLQVFSPEQRIDVGIIEKIVNQ